MILALTTFQFFALCLAAGAMALWGIIAVFSNRDL